MEYKHALVVDDHDMFREGMKLLLTGRLGVESVTEARSVEAALSFAGGIAAPDIVSLDLVMPGRSGVDSVGLFRERWPDAKVVVISASEAREDIIGALAAGAHGYVPKSTPAPELADALRQVLEGRIYAPSVLAAATGSTAQMDQSARNGLNLAALTERQRDVLDELLTGKSTKEIARILDLAEGTVKIHLAVIYRVLGVRSRAEAIARVTAAQNLRTS